MLSSEKTLLRQKFKAIRESIAPDSHTALSRACGRLLVEVIDEYARPPLAVAGYYPHQSEIDIMSALVTLAAHHCAIALPAVEGELLAFRQWKPGDRMHIGEFAVREPEPDMQEMLPDIVIVPLLAFDRKGHRLGYGRGFYDSALRMLRDQNTPLLAIGVGFAAQEEHSLPAEEHDERLDLVVTENEVIRVGG
jgi:5-formyltetrahydrofolate cyclo-ligase